MKQQSIARSIFLISLLAAALAFSPQAHALTITSGPFFTPATNAPLAGILKLTTDVDSRVSVLIGDGTNVWEKDFYDYSTTHSVTLLGFRPDQTNLILVTVYDKDRNAYTAPQLLTFVTDPLPSDFPVLNVLKSEPSAMEPGYMMFIVSHSFVTNAGYITIMDNSGNVVWYHKSPWQGSADVRQLDNGDLFFQEDGSANCFQEMNMLGDIVRTWYPPAGYPVNPHEGLVTSHGTIMYITDIGETVTNFPTSDTVTNPSTETVTVDDNPVVEISFTNSSLLNVWSPLTILDPTRVTYLTYGGGFTPPGGQVDSEHANAIIDDTNDDSIIYSLRTQNAVYKFSRSTGQLEWILGPHALWGTNWQPYLLTPVGTPFNWNYGQHAPELTPQGTLMLYNDNNYAASPCATPVSDPDNYSSAVEYNIDETNMTVSEVWNSAWQTNQDRLYTPYIGRVQWLPQTRNVLVTFGAVTYINGVHPSPYSSGATMARIIEYTHDPVPKVVFDLSCFNYNDTSSGYGGCNCYRAYQISDLYPHPAEPVADLAVSDTNQIPRLEFSADPTHNYLVQASTDLTNWTTIGTTAQGGGVFEYGVGEYDFTDLYANQYTTRFYRVVTQ